MENNLNHINLDFDNIDYKKNREGITKMKENYIIKFATEADFNSWMQLVLFVKDNFPGLDTSEDIEGYQQTLLKNIRRESAVCAKVGDEVVGILLFSYHSSCLSCMAVHPNYRRQGIAEAMITKMLDVMPPNQTITVTTFREGDAKGEAPRALYKKYGFVEDELIMEFNYPHQKMILKRK